MSKGFTAAVFVDHDNQVYGQDRCGLKYDKIIEFIESQGYTVIRANTYMAVDSYKESKDSEYKEKQEGYRNEIRRAGFKVVTKKLKRFTQKDGTIKTKGNVDLELAVDALLQTKNIDYIYIGSGDGDFIRLVNALQNNGKSVIGFGIENISRQLINTVDRYICPEYDMEIIESIYPDYKYSKTEMINYISSQVQSQVQSEIQAQIPSQVLTKDVGVMATAFAQASNTNLKPKASTSAASTPKIEKNKKFTPNAVKPVTEPKLEEGTIMHFDYEKGFGFLIPDDNKLPKIQGKTQGIYFHIYNVLTQDGVKASNDEVYEHLHKNKRMSFRRFMEYRGGGEKKWAAAQITMLDI